MSTQEHTVILSIALLLWSGLAPDSLAQEPRPPRSQSLKEKVIEIPMGSIIEVRLENRQKLRGKLGAVSDSGFELQTVREGSISTQTLGYEQVTSIKHKEKGMSTGAKITLGILAGIGVFVLIVVAVAAATVGFGD